MTILWQLFSTNPPIQTDNIFVGAARVVYGPPLPPVMSWARTFDALMGAATAMHVPRQLQMPILEPIMIPKRSWLSTLTLQKLLYRSLLVPLSHLRR